MSRFRSEPLALALVPGAVGIVSGARAEQLPVVAQDGWVAGLAALSDWLAADKPRAVRARMLVSARHTRLCLVPWPGRHLSAEQWQAWVRLHLETAYGDMQGWRIALDPGRYGQPRLACALPVDLVTQWQGLCKRHRLADGLLQPYAIQAWNHWRRAVRPGQIWAVAESDCIVWSRAGPAGWAMVRSTRARASAEELPSVVAAELQLQGGHAPTGAVFHLPGQLAPTVAGAQAWPVRWLGAAPAAEAACIAMARLAAA